MRIRWTHRAVSDLRAVRRYIAEQNPAAAQAVALKILEAVERLAEFPPSGRVGRMPNTRELIVPGTPFIIPYRIKEGIVEILGVIHGPRAWPRE